MTAGIWKKIDWESIGRAMQEVPLHWQWWVTKYMSRHFATEETWINGNSEQQCNAQDVLSQLQMKGTCLCAQTHKHANFRKSHSNIWKTGWSQKELMHTYENSSCTDSGHGQPLKPHQPHRTHLLANRKPLESNTSGMAGSALNGEDNKTRSGSNYGQEIQINSGCQKL